MGRHAFDELVGRLLNATYGKNIDAYKTEPLQCYTRWLPRPIPALQGDDFGIYILDHIPIEVFRHPDQIIIGSEAVAETIRGIRDDHNIRHPDTYFFLNNIANLAEGALQELVLPQYERLLEANGIIQAGVLVGNADSIAAAPNTPQVLQDFLQNYRDGLAIDLTLDGPRLQAYVVDKYLTSGTGAVTHGLYEPISIHPPSQTETVLIELGQLLQSEPLESRIHEFLHEHFQHVFGFKYDRIESQIWLKLPEIDIDGRGRRLDIFLRNSITSDWELIELKKSTVPLTGRRYRDIPVLSKEIQNSIQQIRNYQRLLSQDTIRRKLAQDGIEYFEPVTRLIVGRGPSIRPQDWRWLLATNGRDVEVITYDQLMAEMRARIKERIQ